MGSIYDKRDRGGVKVEQTIKIVAFNPGSVAMIDGMNIFHAADRFLGSGFEIVIAEQKADQTEIWDGEKAAESTEMRCDVLINNFEMVRQLVESPNGVLLGDYDAPAFLVNQDAQWVAHFTQKVFPGKKVELYRYEPIAVQEED